MTDPKPKTPLEPTRAVSGTHEVAPKACFLVVDDESRMTRTIARALARQGVVVAARSVDQALAVATPPFGWTAVILDVVLPDGTGFDALEALRSRGSLCPALMITGLRDPEVTNRAFELKAELLAKPFDVDLLRRFVASAVAGAEDTRAREAEVRGLAHARSLAFEKRADALLAAVLAGTVARWRVEYRLTDAEIEVVEAVLAGKDRVTIAAERGAKEDTLQKQLGSVFRKMKVSCERQLVWRAMREVARGVRAG